MNNNISQNINEDGLKKNNKESDTESDIDFNINSYSDSDKSFIKKYKKMDNNFGYPKVDDPHLQSKLYAKREFYYYKLPERPNLKNYKEIEEYRKKICIPSGQLLDHQSLLSNFINPDTPYSGLLLFHGTGTGKCLHPCTYINLINKTIEEIWNEYSTDIIQDDDGGEWSKPDDILEILSLHNDTAIKSVVNLLYREKVNTTLQIIKLSNSTEIIKTQVHKLFNIDTQCWTRDIKVGDYIQTYSNDGLFMEYVLDIKNINYSGYVYDLEIDIYHNFVANNIFCHNTCAAIAIAEKFKQQVQRYGTQVYILVPGPLLKENWREHLIKCTGDTYINSNDNLIYLNDEEKDKIKKQAIQNARQYYNVMSYKTFYRKVLGEKIIDKKIIEGNKIKISYKKNDEGEFERDINMDRLHNLNNSLIIVDEAHNLTGNTYGEALIKIIKNSINLKVLLLTATPMKNLADDIIELLNFLRPLDSQIERDLIFTSSKNHSMEIKPGGIEYLQNMATGYVSHFRGADPITFAKKIEIGEKPKGLYFTKIIRCTMGDFQLEAYNKAKELAIEEADSLDRKSEAVANFVFPGLSEDRKKLVGFYGREGLNNLKNQLKNHYEKINKMIGTDILGISKPNEEYININEDTKNITGAFLKKENLKYFSTKFYQALLDIESNLFVLNKKGSSRTGFVYSNLVKIGIEIFQEILIQNGYLSFDENKNNYKIQENTICYYCGETHKHHTDSSTHKFSPATFIVVTGQSSEESAEAIPEDNKRIITNVFNNIDNKDGKNIKLILGSKVMNEGISLANISTVHILDVYFNFGRVDQVIGRAIRWCSHYKLMTEEDPYPEVKIFKYAVCMGKKSNELSTEEDLYFKAEKKYLLIKKVERVLKEVAIDCALNQQGNMFKEEIEFYDKCIKPSSKLLDVNIKSNEKNDKNICPSQCDFTDCLIKCHDTVLNAKYYDPKNNIYKKLSKMELDYSTFTNSLARSEIDFSKKKIKELYMTGYVYNLKTIVDYVKDAYNSDKKDLFNDFFVQKGLDELIPVTENDFNNFKDVIYDKTYRAGYLIYLDSYYIFQPFDEHETVPMYYRTTYQHNYQSKLSLYNYLLNEKFDIINDIGIINDVEYDKFTYNFDDVMDYYDNRKEFKFVGIVDKETNKKKSKRIDEIEDVFKIREKREKILDKKRGTGIPSLKGAVCATSKQKEYLEKLAKDVGIKLPSKDLTRDDICNNIKDKLIELEKYATGKNKMTYIMVPKNHPKLPFPLNLEDRVEYIKNEVDKILSSTVKFTEKVKDKKIELSFKLTSKPIRDELNKLDALDLESKDKLKWQIVIE
jgi:superfamily II DNA or RNA helicase